MATIHAVTAGAEDPQTLISTPPAMSTCRWRQRIFYIAVALVALIAWGVHRITLGVPVFPVDDAYITLHNAQVLRWGRDPNYMGTSALVGATSGVHLALVALLLCFLKPLSALDASLWLAALAYALGLARLAFAHRASLAQAALVVAVGMIVARTPHQLLNGLETGLTLAALVWALALASEPVTNRSSALPALCGLLPYVRPELALVSVLLLYVRARERCKTGGIAEARRAILRDIALCIAGAAPWLIWYTCSTGTPWPSTIGAKRAFFAEAGLPDATKMAWVSANLALFVATVGALTATTLLLILTPVGRVGLVFFVVLIGAYYLEFPGALGHYEQRYMYVLLPFLLYGAAMALGSTHRRLRMAATGLLAIALIQSLANAPQRWREHLGACGFTASQLAGVAQWCNMHLPPGATLLIHDAGYISYATHFHLIDMVGLKTPIAAACQQQVTLPTNGYGRIAALNQIASRTHARYLIVLQGWDRIYQITAGLSGCGWQLSPLRLDGYYRVYRLDPPVDVSLRADAAPAARR